MTSSPPEVSIASSYVLKLLFAFDYQSPPLLLLLESAEFFVALRLPDLPRPTRAGLTERCH
jgi:hypothetical protein